MIAIINYNKSYAEALAAVLSEAGKEASATMNESIICRAESIIFPPSDDVPGVIKKFHIMNLYSMLRLMKKPVLGISSGVELMLEFIPQRKESALCFFSNMTNDCEIVLSDLPPGWYPLERKKECVLLNDVDESAQFYFDIAISYSKTNADIIAEVKDRSSVLAVCKQDDYYGVMFDVLASGGAGKQVLENFTGLSVVEQPLSK